MNIIPDISFWQNDPTTPQNVDFTQMRKWSDGVIIRAGQGSWIDRDFAHNWKAPKEAGLKRGSYWYYDNRYNPREQADLWLSAIKGDIGELMLWCDFEDRSSSNFGRWQDWYDFITRLKSNLPMGSIGIYTGYYYWIEKTITANQLQLDWFEQFPLWIAAYKTNAPLIPQPWKEWLMWQYTDEGDGKKYGVESREIDLNYCKIDMGVKDAPIELPKVGEVYQYVISGDKKMSYEAETIYSGTRIRVDHNTSAAIVETIGAGVIVTGAEVWTAQTTTALNTLGDKWIKTASGWVAIIHKGQTICKNFREVGTVPQNNDDCIVSVNWAEKTVTVENASGASMADWKVVLK